MAKRSKSELVPSTMQAKFAEITVITDDFCQEHLNEEYAELSRQLTAALCRKRPSPLVTGKASSWACGIVHALGMVNFLSDPAQTPYMTMSELYKLFGVSASSGGSKSKQVREIMNMHQLDPEWCLPSNLEKNPLAWLISVNGYIIDARQVPREIQEEAFRRGLIPSLPANSMAVR